MNRLLKARRQQFLSLSLLLGLTLSVTSWSSTYQDATAHLDAGDVNSAIIELKNLLQEDPDNLEGRKLLAYVYMRTNNYSAAESEYANVVRLEPGNTEALLSQARMLLKMGEYKKVRGLANAELVFQPALKSEAHALRGLSYLGERDEKSAEAEFLAALTAAESTRAYAGYATLKLVQMKLEEAHEYADKAIELSNGESGLTVRATFTWHRASTTRA